MQQILDEVFEFVEPYIPLILTTAVASLVLLAGLRFIAMMLIALVQRWVSYEYPTVLNRRGRRKGRIHFPETWLKIEPKAHFKAKEELLANRAVRELYAPMKNYVRELREKEMNLKLAWLSPFPRAVKASIKDAHLPKGQKLMARQQIREAAKRIEICSLPKGIFVGNGYGEDDAVPGETEEAKAKRLKLQDKVNQENHFRINLDATGEDPTLIEKVNANITTQLVLDGGLEPFPSNSAAVTSYLAHREPMIDLLTETKVGASFFKEHPAQSVYAIPKGVKPDLTPWMWETHHTLIFGMTGSGKGSPIQGAIHQLAPFVKQGIAQLWGADPKNAELRVYNEWKSRLFTRISVGMDDEDMWEHAETIAELKKIIGRRSKYGKKTSITAGAEDDGRDFEATEENPLILFIIDEFPTLFKGFEQLGRDGKKPLSDLAQVILTGRSYGVYILAATQRGDKAILDAIIDSMQHKICLRQTNPYFNQLFLGDDYKENGCDPARIPKATKANKYKTAGIGYVADDNGQTKIRFAYISRVEIAALVREFRELDGLSTEDSEFQDFIGEMNDWTLEAMDEGEDELEEFIPEDAERSSRTIEDYILEGFEL